MTADDVALWALRLALALVIIGAIAAAISNYRAELEERRDPELERSRRTRHIAELEAELGLEPSQIG